MTAYHRLTFQIENESYLLNGGPDTVVRILTKIQQNVFFNNYEIFLEDS